MKILSIDTQLLSFRIEEIIIDIHCTKGEGIINNALFRDINIKVVLEKIKVISAD